MNTNMNIPIEIINLFLSFRNIICFWYCKEEEYFNGRLYIS